MNSLDYKKCNEKHMKKAMKYIQIFHGVQIHGNLMAWKIHGSRLSP